MTNMYKNLNHLNEMQIEDLMERYYSGETIKKLLSDFQLDVRASALYKLFPPEEFENYNCEYCDSVLVTDRRSKDLQKAPRYERDLYCPVCGHKPYSTPLCQCESCKQARQELREYQLSLINTTRLCKNASSH